MGRGADWTFTNGYLATVSLTWNGSGEVSQYPTIKKAATRSCVESDQSKVGMVRVKGKGEMC